MHDADYYKREVSPFVIKKALPLIYWLCQHEAPTNVHLHHSLASTSTVLGFHAVTEGSAQMLVLG